MDQSVYQVDEPRADGYGLQIGFPSFETTTLATSSRGNNPSAISVMLRSATDTVSLSLSPFGDRQMISFSEQELAGIPLWRQNIFPKTRMVE